MVVGAVAAGPRRTPRRLRLGAVRPAPIAHAGIRSGHGVRRRGEHVEGLGRPQQRFGQRLPDLTGRHGRASLDPAQQRGRDAGAAGRLTQAQAAPAPGEPHGRAEVVRRHDRTMPPVA